MTPERPIQVGDLVVVVRPTPCCGATDELGLTFTVAEIVRMPTLCPRSMRLGSDVMAFGHPGGPIYASTLKRIDPPPVTETTDTPEKVSA